ncbi:MAG: hypothetical protein AAF432_08965 [Planctomycetota bacterium]
MSGTQNNWWRRRRWHHSPWFDAGMWIFCVVLFFFPWQQFGGYPEWNQRPLLVVEHAGVTTVHDQSDWPTAFSVSKADDARIVKVNLTTFELRWPFGVIGEKRVSSVSVESVVGHGPSAFRIGNSELRRYLLRDGLNEAQVNAVFDDDKVDYSWIPGEVLKLVLVTAAASIGGMLVGWLALRLYRRTREYVFGHACWTCKRVFEAGESARCPSCSRLSRPRARLVGVECNDCGYFFGNRTSVACPECGTARPTPTTATSTTQATP